jgi:hypothetical protein
MDLALQAKPASQTWAFQHNSQTKTGANAPVLVLVQQILRIIRPIGYATSDVAAQQRPTTTGHHK